MSRYNVSGRGSPAVAMTEEQQEEHVYSLLFEECDKEKTGLVNINKLVEYIRVMRSQVQEGEDPNEPGDSEDYNLKVLQAMFEPNCDGANSIDQDKYTDIIRKWVRSIRERKATNSPRDLMVELCETDSPSLSQQQEMNYSYGSYRLDGSNASLDASKELELNDEVAKCQHEIKRLKDQNTNLLMQHETSEEALRESQAKIEQLQQRLEDAQGSVVKLNELYCLNNELNRRMDDTKRENHELTWAKERLDKELEKLRIELDDVRAHLNSAEDERVCAVEEVKAIQLLMAKKMESEKDVIFDYEHQLNESRSNLELVHNDLDNAHNANSELRTTISELELQLDRLKAVKEPFSSTPYPRSAPSLHDELLGQKLINGPVSPLNFSGIDLDTAPCHVDRNVLKEVHVTPAMEEFAKLVEETLSLPQDSKIQMKHSMIVRDLGELVFHQQDSPSTSHHHRENNTSLEDTSLNQVESKLKSLMRKKNQFKNENMNLKQENDDLRLQLELLEGKLSESDIPPRVSRATSPFDEPHYSAVSMTPQSSGVLGSQIQHTGTPKKPQEAESPRHIRSQTSRYSGTSKTGTPGYEETPGDSEYQETSGGSQYAETSQNGGTNRSPGSSQYAGTSLNRSPGTSQNGETYRSPGSSQYAETSQNGGTNRSPGSSQYAGTSLNRSPRTSQNGETYRSPGSSQYAETSQNGGTHKTPGSQYGTPQSKGTPQHPVVSQYRTPDGSTPPPLDQQMSYHSNPVGADLSNTDVESILSAIRRSPELSRSADPTRYSPFHSSSRSPRRSPHHSTGHSPYHSPSQSLGHSPPQSPTRSSHHSLSRTPTHSASHSMSRTPSRSPLHSAAHSPSRSPLHSASHSPSRSPLHSASHSPSYTPSRSPLHSPSHTPSRSPLYSASHSPSRSPLHSASHSPSHTPSRSTHYSAASHTPLHSPSHTTYHSTSHTSISYTPNSSRQSPHHSTSQSPSRSPRHTPSHSPSHSPSRSPRHSPSHSPHHSPSHSPVPLAPTQSLGNLSLLSPTRSHTSILQTRAHSSTPVKKRGRRRSNSLPSPIPIIYTTSPPRSVGLVEDPGLDPKFRMGDFSPKHSSSMREGTGRPGLVRKIQSYTEGEGRVHFDGDVLTHRPTSQRPVYPGEDTDSRGTEQIQKGHSSSTFQHSAPVSEDGEHSQSLFAPASSSREVVTVEYSRQVTRRDPAASPTLRIVPEASQYEDIQTHSWSTEVYSTIKTAVLILLLVVLILAFLLLLVLTRDAVENCGSFCPHSPVQMIYSTLEPYLHLDSANSYL